MGVAAAAPRPSPWRHRTTCPSRGRVGRAAPTILQRSGIGPADTLRTAGVDVVVESPNVGGRMREHRVFTMQFRLVDELGDNELLGSEAGQVAAMEEYETSQSGPLAVPMFDIVGICKTRPEHERPNAQLQIAPFSMRPFEPGKAVHHGRRPRRAGRDRR